MKFGKINFEIRNSYDPWLAALEVTEATFNFGMSAKELKYLGVGLILCCAGLMIQPILWIAKNFCWGFWIKDVSRMDQMVEEFKFDEEGSANIEDVQVEAKD